MIMTIRDMRMYRWPMILLITSQLFFFTSNNQLSSGEGISRDMLLCAEQRKIRTPAPTNGRSEFLVARSQFKEDPTEGRGNFEGVLFRSTTLH